MVEVKRIEREGGEGGETSAQSHADEERQPGIEAGVLHDEGGYEARSSNFKAGIAELLIDEGVKLLKSL